MTDWVAEILARLEAAAEPSDKINVFTVAGTGAFNPRTGAANFPAQVFALLDPDKFNWVPVTYPAAVPWTWSVNAGVSALSHAITLHPGQFVGLGFSQGSMVWAAIFKALISGNLTGRASDWLGTVVMGDPCRKLNTTFDGLTVTTGHHGIADSAHRLTITDDRWQEMVISGDLAADVADDLTGQWMTLVFMALWGGTNPAAALASTLHASPVDLTAFLPELLSYFGLGVSAGAAHTQYDTYVPTTFNGSANSKTMVHLAADYISSLAS